jgi:rRNA biogenesis protein RRP5
MAVPPKSKKIRLDDKSKKHKTHSKSVDAEKSSSAHLAMEEVDFPRGGGTTFTPLEVKTIRAEAHKEVDDELFGVSRRFVHVRLLD